MSVREKILLEEVSVRCSLNNRNGSKCKCVRCWVVFYKHVSIIKNTGEVLLLCFFTWLCPLPSLFLTPFQWALLSPLKKSRLLSVFLIIDWNCTFALLLLLLVKRSVCIMVEYSSFKSLWVVVQICWNKRLLIEDNEFHCVFQNIIYTELSLGQFNVVLQTFSIEFPS